MPKKTPLLSIVRRYFETDPVQAAHSLETMTEEEGIEILKALPSNLTALAFPHLPLSYAATLLKESPEAVFKGIVERIDSKLGADLFSHLPAEYRSRLLESLSPKTKKEIQELLLYPVGSAGRILSTEFLAFHQELKIREAIQKVRISAQKGMAASYTYVVDHENRLVGVINMRDLLIGSPDQTLAEIARKEVFTVNGFMDRETVASELSKRGFFAAPVVDNDGRLLGVVRAEQLIEEVKEEASEDIQKMFGVSEDERAFSPLGFSLRKRLPWLYINLATAFLAAGVVALFENVIARLTILAVFLPVVAGQGGNAGAQSLAITLRGIVMREIPKTRVFHFIFRQTSLGILNGLFVGLVTGLVSWFWHGSPMLGVVIGLAMLVNLFVAGLTGAAIPLTMKAIGFDPAQCSNIILTTFTDCMGFLAFLGLALVFQSYLI